MVAAIASGTTVATQLQIDTGSTFTSVDQQLASARGATDIGTQTAEAVNAMITDPVEGGLTVWTPQG